MKKYLFFVFVFITFHLTVFAQTRDLQVGQGVFDYTTQYGPIRGSTTSFDYASRYALIYLKETVAVNGGVTNGLKVGEKISQLGFYRSPANISFMQDCNIKIYLGVTDSVSWGEGNLDWNAAVSNCTLVYNANPASIVSNTPGIKYFPLIQPYTYYDGNIMLLIEYTQSIPQLDIPFYFDTQLGSTPKPLYYLENQNKYNSSPASALNNILNLSAPYHPRVDFKILTSNVNCTGTATPGFAFSKPSNPCYNQPVYLSLKNGGGVNVTYKWQQSANNITFTDLVGGDSIRTSLIPPQNTITYYRCKLICNTSGQVSFSQPVTITPGTGTITSWVEGFEGVTPPAVPSCLSIEDQNGIVTWASSTVRPYQGVNSFRYLGDQYYPVPAKEWFYSPAIQLTGGTKYSLSYYSRSPRAAATISTWMGTAAINDSMSIPLLQNNTPDSGYKFYVSTFTPASGGIYFAGFNHLSSDPNTLTYIDNIKFDAAPPAPSCETLISPANNTGNFVPGNNVTLKWNVTPGIKGYRVFYGEQNNVLQVSYLPIVDSFTVKPNKYNTTYKWYVVPVNEGGEALNCAAGAFSFTTMPEPLNCLPLYNPDFTIACWDTTNIMRFKITGELGTQINNSSSDFDCGTPGSGATGYGNYTSLTPVKLTRGFSYAGIISNGFSSFPTNTDNRLHSSIWIDFNDNGYYEGNERLLNNLYHTANDMNFSIFIPVGSALGIHKMRVRNVAYDLVADSVTGPCDYYKKGETEDYRAEILATQTGTPVIAPGLPAQCNIGSYATIGPSSNNINGWVPLLDSANKLIAAINANGNDLGTISLKYYINNTALPRKDAQNIYYLDRNVQISVTKQPLTPVGVRLYLLNAELNKLITTPGSGVNNIADLNATKNNNTCNPSVTGPNGQLLVQSSNGINGTGPDYYVEYHVNSFSSFYMHGGLTPIPVVLSSFTIKKQNENAVLNWNCSDSYLAERFEIEFSSDGSRFIKTGEVSPVANQESYNYTDRINTTAIRYYRIKVVEKSGKVVYSEIKFLDFSKFNSFTVAPNPVKGECLIRFDIAGFYEVNISDASGRKLFTQSGNFELLKINTAAWSKGLFLIQVKARNGSYTSTYKIIKQ